MSPAEGEAAPTFERPATGGRTVRPAARRDRAFVLDFHPRASTPGRTRQACAFQEAVGAARVDRVGRDRRVEGREGALERLAAAYGPSLPPVSDTSGVAEAYGAWVEKGLCGERFMGVDRGTVLVGVTGRVARTRREVEGDGRAAEVPTAARELG